MQVPVLIAGGGPVGLALGVGLAHHGVEPLVVEQEPALAEHSRAPGILPRTLEVLRAWDLQEVFLDRGILLEEPTVWVVGDDGDRPAAVVHFSDLAPVAAVAGVLVLPQNRTEELLAERLREGGRGELRFGHRLVSFEDRGDAVVAKIEPADGVPYEVETQVLVGCDGAHSTVRQRLGWELVGKTYPSRVMLVDVRLPPGRGDLPFPRVVPRGRGVLFGIRMEDRLWRMVATLEPGQSEQEALGDDHVGELVRELYGEGPYEPVWRSVFHIHCRNSPHFRRGRVLLAGDAGHLNSPAGGQGMNGGIQDAHNLAWKLARWLAGRGDGETLLASYEAERRPVVLSSIDRTTDRLTRIAFSPLGPLRNAAAHLAAHAVEWPAVRRRLLPRMAMLDTRYTDSPLLAGEGELLGARAPNCELLTGDGRRLRLHDLAAKNPALLLFDDGRLPAWDAEAVRGMVGDVPGLAVHRLLPHAAEATAEGDLRAADRNLWRSWQAAPGLAALLRPDGHVGWIGHRPRERSLLAAVRHGLGAAA